jgi:hypothetical protein
MTLELKDVLPGKRIWALIVNSDAPIYYRLISVKKVAIMSIPGRG